MSVRESEPMFRTVDLSIPSTTAATQNRVKAANQYGEAQALAITHGMRLVRKTESHYQLYPNDKGWLLNIYPGPLRLYSDPTHRAPYLKVREPWGLLDVIKAAAIAQRQNGD